MQKPMSISQIFINKNKKEMENINITAQDVESFKKVEELLKKLPNNILSQIKAAKFCAIGLECIIKDKFEAKQKIFLPNKVTQISDFDDYIGIYCDKFFFKIIGDSCRRMHDFIFIECDEF